MFGCLRRIGGLFVLCIVAVAAYVMRDRTISGELSRSELTEENILGLAMLHV